MFGWSSASALHYWKKERRIQPPRFTLRIPRRGHNGTRTLFHHLHKLPGKNIFQSDRMANLLAQVLLHRRNLEK